MNPGPTPGPSESDLVLLDVRGLHVHYGGVPALRGVSLRVGAGEFVALVGANGAGKTTTLRAISRIVPAAAGSIAIGGTRADRLPSHRIVRLGVAHVPEGRRIFPTMSVEENLLLGALAGEARRERPRSLADAYALFPILGERRRQAAGSLSGGEQQMLAIARALMARPRLLMLDEPSLGLAPLVVRQLFEVVAAVHRRGVAVLLAEQNVQGALRLADRAYVLENGIVALEGPGRELLADPRVRTAYLGAAAVPAR